MLTLEQYHDAIERLQELTDSGLESLSPDEREEYERLAKETEEFEAHDHRTTGNA